MQIIDFYNNPNIGLFFYTTDKVTFVPIMTPEKVIEMIKDELKTKIIQCDVYNTSVLNIFLVGNEEYLFVPTILSEEDIKSVKKSKLKVVIVDTKLNALGNNMVFSGKNVLINPAFEDSVVELLESKGFKVSKGLIADVGTVGANVMIFEKNALINPDATNSEIDFLEKALGVSADYGTVNNGSKIVKAGLVVNKHGVLISKSMSGPEMMRIEELI